MLTGHNIETMTALTLMSYPFDSGQPPVYLALAPLTHAAGRALLPGHDARRRDRHHAGPRPGRVPRPRRAPPGHPRVPAADADLPAARPPGPARRRPQLAALPLVRGRADVQPPGWSRPSRRSARSSGQLFGQTEAPMMISTLAPARPPQPGRHPGPRPVRLGRAADAADHRGDHGRGRQPAAAGGARRDRGPRPAGDPGLLQEPERDRRGVPARLAPHRRHRLPGRRQLPVHRRPAQGHDHHRRLQRLLGRGRAGPAGPPGESSTARSSACRTTSGASGSPPSSSAARASRSTRTRSVRSSGSGSAASRRPSRWRSGPTCRAPASARSSRPRSSPACSAHNCHYAPDLPVTTVEVRASLAGPELPP